MEILTAEWACMCTHGCMCTYVCAYMYRCVCLAPVGAQCHHTEPKPKRAQGSPAGLSVAQREGPSEQQDAPRGVDQHLPFLRGCPCLPWAPVKAHEAAVSDRQQTALPGCITTQNALRGPNCISKQTSSGCHIGPPIPRQKNSHYWMFWQRLS